MPSSDLVKNVLQTKQRKGGKGESAAYQHWREDLYSYTWNKISYETFLEYIMAVFVLDKHHKP